MTKSNQIISLGEEQAYEEIERLDKLDRYNSGGCDVYRGIHPEYGPMVIVIPVMGSPVGVPLPDCMKPEVTAIINADL